MKIKLADWAAERYRPAPTIATLRRWVREGAIHPQPELVGRAYYVEESARRLTANPAPRLSLVERLRSGA